MKNLIFMLLLAGSIGGVYAQYSPVRRTDERKEKDG